jgi:hypothetical protein
MKRRATCQRISETQIQRALTQRWTPALPNPIPAVEAAKLPISHVPKTCKLKLTASVLELPSHRTDLEQFGGGT